jgi:hypothetical protein
MKTVLAAAVLAVVIAASAFAADPEVTRYPNVGTWGLAVDHTLGNGCFTVGTFALGAIRIGFDATPPLPDGMPGRPYAELMGQAVDALAADRLYQLDVQFTGRSAIRVKAYAWRTERGRVALTFLLSVSLYRGFSEAAAFSIAFVGGARGLSGELKGSRAAIDAVIQCQARQNSPGASISPPTSVPLPEPRSAWRLRT